jgi:esterase
MYQAPHRTGTIRSDDVEIFYRAFGRPGATPIVILHGANYYDSYDWIDVAAALAEDRDVIAYDSRGHGESGWSATKNYSYDANLGDLALLIDHLGWQRTILLGSSRGGAYALLYGARYPERAAGVIMVDWVPTIGIGHYGAPPVTTPQVNLKPKIYPTMEAALATMSRDRNVPEGSPARARLAMILKPVAGGYINAKRDPDSHNRSPIAPAGWTPTIPVDIDMWGELKKVRAPIMFVRGKTSEAGYPLGEVERLRREAPGIEVIEVDSGHDVAAGAPEQLIVGVKRFIASRIEGRA